MSAYKMKCRNDKCGGEFHRYFNQDEFEKTQYSSGWSCFNCGFPRMIVGGSKRLVKDGFQPGWQSSIRKHCDTYSEYKLHLKNLGLIEIGNEDFEAIIERNNAKVNHSTWNDKSLAKAISRGFTISDNEAEALKAGTY